MLVQDLHVILCGIDNYGDLAHEMLDRKPWVKNSSPLFPDGALGQEKIFQTGQRSDVFLITFMFG